MSDTPIICGHCREPITRGAVREFGFYQAHMEADCLSILLAKVAAVTAERDALREAAERLSKAAENMLLYWQTGNGVTVDRATIRHDDPIVDALRAALRRP